MIPHFDANNLFDIPVTDAAGASPFLPFGYIGIWAAIPYAIWFFLAIEGVPLAAEETSDPQRDLPRGLIGGILVLLASCALILTFGPGGAGADALKASGNPLVEALESAKVYGGPTWVSRFVNFVGLAGLIASFFSIIFGYSRLVFAMSRAGYLPRALSLTNARKTPYVALIVPGIIGFLLSLSGQGDLLILIAVFGATISYVMMMASHIALRIREPNLERPYRTPGGILTSGIALVLACVAVVAGFLVDPRVVIGAAVVYAIFIAYFGLYSRHHLVAAAPGEEEIF
jgi:ethanolamine permease